jgi:hypothetical protein
MKLLKFIGVVAVFLVPNSSPAQEDSDSRAASRARAERCVQGTYYNRETSGTQTFYSLTPGGTFQGVNSAASVLGFSGLLGNWEIVADNPIEAEVTYFDFVFDPVSVVPLLVARVDISIVFGDDCETIEGALELRLFGPQGDPLDPSSSPVVSQSTFEGRRVR